MFNIIGYIEQCQKIVSILQVVWLVHSDINAVSSKNLEIKWGIQYFSENLISESYSFTSKNYLNIWGMLKSLNIVL